MAEGTNNNFDLKHLERLSGKEAVSQNDLNVLKTVLDNKDDLFKSFFGIKLEKNVQEKMSEFFQDLDLNRIEDLLKSEHLSSEEKQNLSLLLEKYSASNNLERQKQKELKNVIKKTHLELQYFQGQVMEQAAYKVENLRQTTSVEATGNTSASEAISEAEMQTINTFLDGK